ncbi:carbohydrate porin [Variovorax sp. J22P168]|uniref:carbohydrate porin n=1 Tax=Variovorax jilinensis TaxID=3053513 RepID=UPI0025762B25|nr:carbohydrate porin [Variovorax sp. J22P168]MDM0014937.1 carbohydrate porin [Variovorax sp. J22P168]
MSPAPRLLTASTLVLFLAPALSQTAAPEDPLFGGSDVAQVGKIGRMHDRLRSAQKRESPYQEISGAYRDYVEWKGRVQKDANLSYSLDLSLLQQWGSPDGGSPAMQAYVSPSVDWTAFKSSRWGTGSVQMAYNLVKYPTNQNAADIQSKLGLITPINDFGANTQNFAQLTYTQASPDNKWLVTAGQFPLYNFDGNAYLGSQQQNFNNYVFAQNGSATYLTTGLGAYVQYNATKTVQLAAGFQGTNNLEGKKITATNIGDDCCAWFGYVQWTPQFAGLGSSQYSLSYFDTPSLPSQESTRAWSINAVQNLDDTWGVFGRANGASGYVTSIKRSYAVGVAMNNPLKRASTDQIAVAVGTSVAANPPTNPAGARDEVMVEAYWTWTVFGGLLLTPSVQYISNPALHPTRDSVWVGSLRATFLF